MNHTHDDDQLQRHIELGHETRDANVKWLMVSGAALFGLIVGTLILMNWTFDYFAKGNRLVDAPRPPLADARVSPSGPLLQVSPYQDLKDFRAKENEILHGYYRHYAGNQPLDTVSIPIDKAMDLIVERGLPATTQPAMQPAVATSQAGK